MSFYYPKANMREMHADRINREMERNDTAARIYKRRAEFASAGYLYFGDAESHAGARGVDDIPPNLINACTTAGLVHYASGDLDFDVEGTGRQG